MSPLATQPVENPKADATQPAVPRKRRRRAAATGATEDCFTCRKRQIKCDRRRPYCTQCIDLGKECSGYRTTLTWGVGVASRGKLRGMSLPVPKSPSAQTSPRSGDCKAGSTSPARSVPSSASATTPAPEHLQPPPVDFGQPPTLPSSPHSSTAFDFGGSNATSPIPIPSAPTSNAGWHVPGFEEHVEGFSTTGNKAARGSFHPGPLQRLHTSLAQSYDDAGMSASTGSLSAYSDSDFPSPSEYPQTPEELPLIEPLVPQYGDMYLHQSMAMNSSESLPYNEAPRSYPVSAEEVSSSIRSVQGGQGFMDSSSGHSGTFGTAILPDAAIYRDERNSASGNALRLSGNVHSSQLFNLSPRMHFLLDYYDKAICPVLVAFDGPNNPYRAHILRQAYTNESLQNAIAALSLNNRRMRGTSDIRRLTMGEYAHSGSPSDAQALAYRPVTTEGLQQVHGEPSAEELRYKATSIEQLNQLLADPHRAKDDSVLATLLVLCLFHVCDSGFTKFKTQLAGVQKLLSMRNASESRSDFVNWIEVFFTWFDVMTSAVNDRETEMRGDALDMPNLSANLGALEHLAGCEGRLFKLIARLGRLNLLSQNRPVSNDAGCFSGQTTPRASPPLAGPRHQQQGLGGGPPGHATFASVGLHSLDRLDGNGWGAPLTDAPEESPWEVEDPRRDFWREWRDLRDRLEEWQLGPEEVEEGDGNVCGSNINNNIGLAMGAGGDGAALADRRDVRRISESFRAAALLYIERLAHPEAPAAAGNIQALVARTLSHAAAIPVTSCVNKFLLWPLFMAGTECIDGAHRALVRQRCIEIQRESGFFNNLSGLEVLEKTWREDDERAAAEAARFRHHAPPGRERRQPQAFRWRRAMDRADGEYIVL
ncbi:fungal-specific transcription factor domain-containing protein [Lineolata rhizophorae]|uniref:Fungal-specific transcription factor domain-containing protein n=1 Tax=Lineolata rhizophorae TaxID=578093 RepID=A0A6A6P8V1_9PEZI|nr:fungal-specific transcription factor domain-containing protein [Lineolata rhizophorae]